MNTVASFLETKHGKIFYIFHKGDENRPLVVLVHGHKETHLGPSTYL